MLSVDPSKDGTGYCYPIINYDNKITWPYNLDFNPLFPDRLTDDYLIFPAVAAKQIFDKIFEENNYTYEVSSEIEEILKELYIPFNEEYLNRTTIWLYSKGENSLKVEIKIKEDIIEPYAIIYTSALTDEIQKAAALISMQENTVPVMLEEKIFMLKPDEIFMVRVENNSLAIYSESRRYLCKKRLYEISEILSAGFMQTT